MIDVAYLKLSTEHEISRVFEKMVIKIAWLLPERLVYWCALRVIAHATSGQYSNQVVPELKAMEALHRWGYP
jgi:hypothetical protein